MIKKWIKFQKKGLTQWQYNKMQVLIKKLMPKFEKFLDEVLIEGKEYLDAEGWNIDDGKL